MCRPFHLTRSRTAPTVAAYARDNNFIEGFEYDGLGRIARQINVVDHAPVSVDLYYSDSWQLIEIRDNTFTDDESGGAPGTILEHYVYSAAYVDAPIERDRDTDNNGSLDERLYFLHDANFNVTAVVATIAADVGVVQERFVNDAYGRYTVNDASDWSITGDDTAPDALKVRQHKNGLLFDVVIGLTVNRERFYSATMNRFLNPDPTGYVDGLNWYVPERDNPIKYVDPSGRNVDPDWTLEFGVMTATEAQIRADYFYDSWNNINGRPHENDAEKNFKWWSAVAQSVSKKQGKFQLDTMTSDGHHGYEVQYFPDTRFTLPPGHRLVLVQALRFGDKLNALGDNSHIDDDEGVGKAVNKTTSGGINPTAYRDLGGRAGRSPYSFQDYPVNSAVTDVYLSVAAIDRDDTGNWRTPTTACGTPDKVIGAINFTLNQDTGDITEESTGTIISGAGASDWFPAQPSNSIWTNAISTWNTERGK